MATGMTLYLFTKDEGTTTACTGECAANWPPIVAEDPTGGDGIDAALLGTADGIEPNQVTYNGHLLYYFANDTAPGDTNGVGLPELVCGQPRRRGDRGLSTARDGKRPVACPTAKGSSSTLGDRHTG